MNRFVGKQCQNCGALLRTFVEQCPMCLENPDAKPRLNPWGAILYFIFLGLVIYGVACWWGWV